MIQGWPAEQVERGSHRLGDEAHQIASHGITRVNQLHLHFTKRCRLSWLTNSALVYEPKCGGVAGLGSEYSCTHGAKKLYFGDVTPYLTCVCTVGG
jgi:hypothetical protein